MSDYEILRVEIDDDLPEEVLNIIERCAHSQRLTWRHIDGEVYEITIPSAEGLLIWYAAPHHVTESVSC